MLSSSSRDSRNFFCELKVKNVFSSHVQSDKPRKGGFQHVTLGLDSVTKSHLDKSLLFQITYLQNVEKNT